MIRLPSGREHVHIFPHSFLFHIFYLFCVSILPFSSEQFLSVKIVHLFCFNIVIASLLACNRSPNDWRAKPFCFSAFRHVVHHRHLHHQLWQPLSSFHTCGRVWSRARLAGALRPCRVRLAGKRDVFDGCGRVIETAAVTWSPWGFTLVLVFWHSSSVQLRYWYG